jgi:hypothetical protein
MFKKPIKNRQKGRFIDTKKPACQFFLIKPQFFSRTLDKNIIQLYQNLHSALEAIYKVVKKIKVSPFPTIPVNLKKNTCQQQQTHQRDTL